MEETKSGNEINVRSLIITHKKYNKYTSVYFIYDYFLVQAKLLLLSNYR